MLCYRHQTVIRRVYPCTQNDQIHGGKEYLAFALSPNLVVAWITQGLRVMEKLGFA